VGDRAVTESAFTLVGLPPDAAEADLFGVWAAVAPRSASAAAFAVGPDAAPTLDPVWRIDLSADTDEAGSQLATAEARVAAATGATGEAADRLLAFARRQAVGQSFAASPEVDAGAGLPERELAALLAEAAEVPGVASYGLGDTVRSGWQEVTEWFSTVVRTVLAPLDRLATVETASEGMLIARTRIGFAGGCDSVWRAGVDPARAALHGRAVGLALATRAALVRTLALALRGAAVVAVAVGTPGGPLVALPAVWRFVTQVQKEVASIRQGLARGETGNGQR
jgi:hypothetical protein